MHDAACAAATHALAATEHLQVVGDDLGGLVGVNLGRWKLPKLTLAASGSAAKKATAPAKAA